MQGDIIYYVMNTDQICEEEITMMKEMISPGRVQKAERYRRKTDRNNCIAAYALLQYGILLNFGLKRLPDIICTQYGKPHFKNIETIHFNLSHSTNAVCCGISNHNIGVDIQESISDYENILEMVMSDREISQIKEAKDPSQLAAKYWSLKEAYVKYLGTGLTEEIKRYDFSGRDFSDPAVYWTTKTDENHQISAVSQHRPQRYIKIDLKDYMKQRLFW